MHRPQLAGLRAIEHHASLSPQSPALLSPDGPTLTYAELWAYISAIGARLQDAGASSEDVVAVLLPQGLLQALVVNGVLGYCVCAPLQPRTTVPEVEVSLRRLSASALVTSSEFDDEVIAASAIGLTVIHANVEQPPDQWSVQPGSQNHRTVLAFPDTALLLMTSASTGYSKVVPLTTANLDAGILARNDALKLQRTDRLLLMTSLSHIIGIENPFAQFLVGGSVLATEGFDSNSYLRWLRDLRPTWYDCAPTVHQAALVRLRGAPRDVPHSLRFVQSAGAPLPDEIRQRLSQILQVPIFNDYGMTEACPIAFDAFLAGGPAAGSAGRARGLDIGILDSSGCLVGPNNDGEIVVRGAAVFPGYLDDPEATRAAFHNGWFRTGDLGRLDQDGNLYVTGRLKEMINRGGEKILPGEVDAAFESHPAVLEAAAFAIPHPTLGEDVACAVVLRDRDASQVSARELRRYTAQYLASFKIPHRIYFVDEIPRGELGKPQRWALAEQMAEKRSAPPTPAEFSEQSRVNAILVNLHEMWGRILDRDDLNFDADFFEAGGDSLAAITMLAEVDERFGSQTSAIAASFIDEPTLPNLLKLVDHRIVPTIEDSCEMQIFPVRTSGCATHLYCIPDTGVEGFYFRRLARRLVGTMDVSIIRPANTIQRKTLFCIERAGTETAEAIRRTQPEGPYLLSGYCYGGVVAYEAARQLSLLGQDVRVVLFDVPMPGSPGLLRDWRVWARRAGRQWNRIWTSDHPGLRRNLHTVAHRLLWNAVIPFRRFLEPIEHKARVQSLLRQAEFEYFPLYRAHPIHASFLHILSSEPTIDFDSDSRFGWRSIARGGIEEQYVAFDHYNIFDESNLPQIAKTLTTWIGVHSGHDLAVSQKS